MGRYAKSTIKNHHFKLSNAFRHPYLNRTITGTSERQGTLAPSLTLARRYPHLLKAHKETTPSAASATKGVVSIYRLGASPPAQLTAVNRSQHRRRTRILTATTQQPPCWAWGLRSRGCGYAPQYVPQPHPRARRSPACCRGNGTKQHRAPHPHRQQSE